MFELRERAMRSAGDLAAMMAIAEEVRWAPDARPDQVSAAESVRRSIMSLDQKQTEMKEKVLQARYAKLLAAL